MSNCKMSKRLAKNLLSKKKSSSYKDSRMTGFSEIKKDHLRWRKNSI